MSTNDEEMLRLAKEIKDGTINLSGSIRRVIQIKDDKIHRLEQKVMQNNERIMRFAEMLTEKEIEIRELKIKLEKITRSGYTIPKEEVLPEGT